MKYFSPSYWFKLWLLSAPLFNDETIGINAKSIDNKKIKDWASKNTNLQSINQDISFTNSSTNYQPYTLNQQLPNQNIDPFYQTALETITHKHRHQKSRNKRQQRNNNIVFVSDLEINQNLSNYRSSILRIINILVNHHVIEEIFERDNVDNMVTSRQYIYQIVQENNPYQYFIIPVVHHNINNDHNLRLVFRVENFFLQGFLINNYYYFFSDAILQNFRGLTSLPSESGETYISHNLGFDGHYNTLWTRRLRDERINRLMMINSFAIIANWNYNERGNNQVLRENLALIILSTAEALRFRRINQLISQMNENEATIITWDTVQSTILYWSNESRRVLDVLFNVNQLLDNREYLRYLLRYLGISIILGNIQRQCNRRNKRESAYDEWKKETCDIEKLISDQIQGKITAIAVLDESNKGDDLKAGDIYVGTDNGVYLIHGENKVYKFSNIDEEVTSIKNIVNDKFYVTTKEKEEVYFLNTAHIYMSVLFEDGVSNSNIYGEIKTEIKSSDLNKELRLYYNNDKIPKTFSQTWGYNYYYNNLIKNFDLYKINPLNYQKIEFLGKNEDFKETRISWGNEPYYPDFYLNHFNNKILDNNIITNIHINNNFEKTSEIPFNFVEK